MGWGKRWTGQEESVPGRKQKHEGPEKGPEIKKKQKEGQCNEIIVNKGGDGIRPEK